MIDRGMDNDKAMLKGLVAKADTRIAELRSGERPALSPDANAEYAAEFVVDLDNLVDDLCMCGLNITERCLGTFRLEEAVNNAAAFGSGQVQRQALAAEHLLDLLGQGF